MIENLGFNDFTVGTQLFKTLGLGEIEIKDLATVMKVKELAKFLNKYPDPFLVIEKTRKNINPNFIL